MPEEQNTLGAKLRDVRTRQNLSLREVSRRADVASGYLSQLERGDVAQPTPSTLQRLAEAYGTPVLTLMGWAGYATEQPPVSPQLAKAMNYIGPDPSDDEVEAIRAVLKVLRNRSATFSAPHPLDRSLSPVDQKIIRDIALAALRKADALGSFPTPLEQVMAVGKLVYAGEISLTAEERRGLRSRFGDLVTRVLENMQGLMTFRSGEIYLAETLHPKRRRFVLAHEIGHDILPIHRELAYADNWETMHADLRNACEREANQAAIEMLSQGDKLREIADDSLFGRETISALARTADISLQATARRIAEESNRPCAAVIYYKGGSRLMPPHIYTSDSFEKRFRWHAGLAPLAQLKEALRGAGLTIASESLTCTDVGGREISLRCEAIDTPKALIGFVAMDATGPLAKMFPLRTVRVRSAAA
jgi:transcriptional regulator with XRE-family HTH domain